jgi:uncharacterized membrane protein YphA (DoxX/SURF4 family)
MNSWTRFFLILLRLAIGWHFLVEGYLKLDSVYVGPAQGNRPFTSAGYLGEANGPLGGFLHRQLGDPNQAALDRVTVKPLAPGEDGGKTSEYKRTPPALAEDWNTYLHRFDDHYKLDEHQRDRAETTLKQGESAYVTWLLTGQKERVATYPSGTVNLNSTIPEWVAAFKASVAHLEEMETRDETFGRDVAKEKLAEAKADVARQRTALLAAVQEQTDKMKAALAGLLTPEQKKLGPVPESAGRPHWLGWDWQQMVWWFAWWTVALVGVALLVTSLAQLVGHWGNRDDYPAASRVTSLGTVAVGAVLLIAAAVVVVFGWDNYFNLGTYPGWRDYTRLEWMDWFASWGLFMIGVGLLLGFLTRTACVAGAVFLLLLYLTIPPFPWLPEPSRSEGHYVYVNKNLIEMLALLVLATTRSGRWLGVDGLLQFLSPWRWRRRPVLLRGHRERDLGRA